MTRVKASRVKVDDLEARLKEAREEHAKVMRGNAGILQIAAVKVMRDAMREMFSMGPAWTTMRTLSSHVSRAEIRHDDVLADEDVPDLRKARQADSILATQTLDMWGGDVAFDSALRDAIMKVVKRFGKKGLSAGEVGRRPQTKGRYNVSINARTRHEAREIMDGLLVTDTSPGPFDATHTDGRTHVSGVHQESVTNFDPSQVTDESGDNSLDVSNKPADYEPDTNAISWGAPNFDPSCLRINARLRLAWITIAASCQIESRVATTMFVCDRNRSCRGTRPARMVPPAMQDALD